MNKRMLLALLTTASRLLGISRATLIKKIREYELGERPSAASRAGRAMHD
jgi:cytochrome c553